jgi:hypothetical protein
LIFGKVFIARKCNIGIEGGISYEYGAAASSTGTMSAKPGDRTAGMSADYY